MLQQIRDHRAQTWRKALTNAYMLDSEWEQEPPAISRINNASKIFQPKAKRGGIRGSPRPIRRGPERAQTRRPRGCHAIGRDTVHHRSERCLQSFATQRSCSPSTDTGSMLGARVPSNPQGENECDEQMNETIETVAPHAESTGHQTYRKVVNIPASRWYSRWQWKAQSPGLVASKATTTRRPGGTSTVSRMAPENLRPSISTT